MKCSSLAKRNPWPSVTLLNSEILDFLTVLLPGIGRDHKRTGTHKHMETVSRYFDWHGRLSQSKDIEEITEGQAHTNTWKLY